MSTPVLSPANDFGLIANLQDFSRTTGVKFPLTTGTVTAFLATSNAADAVAADSSLSMSAVYVGAQVGRHPGDWLVFWDATDLTLALLDPLFAAATPYLIITYPAGIRVFAELAYLPTKPAVVR
jgi:hypothetical protein